MNYQTHQPMKCHSRRKVTLLVAGCFFFFLKNRARQKSFPPVEWDIGRLIVLWLIRVRATKIPGRGFFISPMQSIVLQNLYTTNKTRNCMDVLFYIDLLIRYLSSIRRSDSPVSSSIILKIFSTINLRSMKNIHHHRPSIRKLHLSIVYPFQL